MKSCERSAAKQQGTHRPDVGPVVRGPRQDVGAIRREAGADVERAVDVTGE